MDTETRGIIIAGMAFFTGLLLGLGTGILLAPQAGAETRRRVGEAVDETSNQVGEWVENAKDTVQDLSQEGKKLASRFKMGDS